MSAVSPSQAPVAPLRRVAGGVGRFALPTLLAGLAAALVLVAVRSQAPAETLPFDPDSPAAEGHLALRLWFEEQGYATGTTAGAIFTIPADANLLVVAPGLGEWSESEAQALKGYLERGGAVALIHPAAESLQRVLALGQAIGASAPGLRQSQPLLPSSPAQWEGTEGFGTVDAAGALAPSRNGPDVAALTSGAGEPTLLVRQVGDGWLWQMATPHALTNADLQAPEQVAVAAALLRRVPQGGLVLFDTFHLFGPDDPRTVRTLQEWLVRTAAGRALLFALLVSALFVLLQGRRLGPALASQPDGRRREAAEYVRALAGLKRRASTLQATADYQRARLKSGLAQHRGLPASVDDHEFVRLLRDGDQGAGVSVDQVERLLATLAAARDEAAVVHAAAEIDQVLGRRASTAPRPRDA